MAEYDDTNRGALFKNDKKEKDTQPDYRGSLNVGGVEYWLSAWLKESKAGKKFMSLSVTVKEDKPESKPDNSMSEGPFSDDIPFNRITNEYCR